MGSHLNKISVIVRTSVNGRISSGFSGNTLPEQPNKYYFVICGQKIVLEAEQNIQAIM